jgi:hypothetical protein
LAFVLAACGGPVRAAHPQSGPTLPGGPHVLVRITDVQDDVCGTSCAEYVGERVVRLAADGSFEPINGTALRHGPGAQPWGVHVGSGAVRVGWPGGESIEIPLQHFGDSPRLIWSPTGHRFAVLETWGDKTVDRLLVVDPKQRRWLLLPRTSRAVEITSAAFLSDDRLIAQTFDSHDYLRLTRFDAVTGRVVSSQYSLLEVIMNMQWSPAAQRLAVQDVHGHVGLVALAHPNRTQPLKVAGAPSWSSDATRILTVPTDEDDATRVQLIAWPRGTHIRLPGLFDAQWMPDTTSLIGLQGDIPVDSPGRVPRVVQVGPNGQIEHVIPVHWPASEGGYFPTEIPIAIEGIDPD